jgi:hypothetical protein
LDQLGGVEGGRRLLVSHLEELLVARAQFAHHQLTVGGAAPLGRLLADGGGVRVGALHVLQHLAGRVKVAKPSLAQLVHTRADLLLASKVLGRLPLKANARSVSLSH